MAAVKGTLLAAAFLCVTVFVLSISAAERDPYDVVVYGGTSAGVAAAIQSSRMGKSVVLIAPHGHLGGLTTNGLGWTDSGNKAAVGGIAREFYRAVKRHYDRSDAWIHEDPKSYDRYHADADAMWTFEPHVAEQIIEDMLAACTVTVMRNEWLDRSFVKTDAGWIRAIRTESGEVLRGRMFVDATYEGDLMAAAGVGFTVGRESNDRYGETLNGIQKRQNIHNHRFVVPIDPYKRAGDRGSGLLPGVHGDSPGADGEGDRRIQAYCYRMCMSNVPANRTPFTRPADYDEARYELLLRNFEAGDLRLPLHLGMMPNGKTDTNNNGAFSTDYIGMSNEFPEADYERRREITREHRSYQQGLLWTLVNHPRVPAAIRDEMRHWGLAADEFVDNGNWPRQLYVREGRRMVSDYVMTELDCRGTRVPSDSIGMGSYNMDSHNVQRYVTPDGHVQNEGDVQVPPGDAYRISYRAVVPKAAEARNLLVPVCLSASHIAYGSVRMEPVFFILGQSAATAACLALDEGVGVQQLSYERLKPRLIADAQVLRLPAAE